MTKVSLYMQRRWSRSGPELKLGAAGASRDVVLRTGATRNATRTQWVWVDSSLSGAPSLHFKAVPRALALTCSTLSCGRSGGSRRVQPIGRQSPRPTPATVSLDVDEDFVRLAARAALVALLAERIPRVGLLGDRSDELVSDVEVVVAEALAQGLAAFRRVA